MKAMRKIMAEGSGLIARRLGRALPADIKKNGERISRVKSARPLMPVMHRLHPVHRRHNRTQSVIKAGLLLAAALLGFPAHAATPPGTVISNTAQAAYQVNASPRITTTPSNTVTNTVVAPSSASLAVAFNPDIVRAGGSTSATTQICNTGGSPIPRGVLTLTPPAGATMTIPADPYGNYTAVPPTPPGVDWVVTLTNPLAAGGCISIPSNVTIPANTPSGTLSMTVGFTGGGLPPVNGVATLTVQNIRTPSTTTFMQIDPATGQLVPASLYHAGQTIYVQVQDLDQNLDPLVAETRTATVVDSVTGDTETVTITETGPNTGIFVGSVPSTTAAATPNDGTLSVAQGSQLTATYTDIVDGTDSTSAAALVDPAGLVFDSSTGQPIDGVTITLINAATGRPATVLGDTGASFPSTVTTGGTATDAAGNVYNFGPGRYRFPQIAPGTYRLQVTPPAGYSMPSTVPTATLQLLPGAPFAIVTGSRGENFVVNPGPAIHIDVPLDPKAPTLFVQKTAGKTKAAIGDFVPYTITVENTSAIDVANVSIQDTLPLGFRYQPGSAKLNGAGIADPVIAADGRRLTFSVGTLAAGAVDTLTYVAEITANARLGDAVNTATASGTSNRGAAGSNTAKATLTVTEDLFISKATIAGRVFVDEDDDGFNDKNEPGVAGIRIFMEDGRFVMTDKNGMFHFEGVTPGTHVVQMDLTTIPERYEAAPLANTRFSGRAFSQFAEARGGGLWRSNFRLLRKAPPATPVKIAQRLSNQDGKLWTTITVTHGKKVALDRLQAVYIAPAGWKVLEETATVNGVPARPEGGITGLTWNLDPKVARHEIRFALQGDGDTGEKKAIAYARFASAGTPRGRTGMAIIALHDDAKEERLARDVTLHLNFDTRKAVLKPEALAKLDKLVEELKNLEITRIELFGHTDIRPIREDHRDEFRDNQELSEARAKAVAEYLRKKLHLQPEQVTAKGFGATKPIASNATAAGRAKNRRTEMKVYAIKVKHILNTKIESASAAAEGKAEDSWDKKSANTKAAAKPAHPAPADIDAWLASARPGIEWLYPGAKDLPAIPATHVLIKHAPDQKVTLTVNGEAVHPLTFEGAKKNAAGNIAISHWRNVHLKEGDNTLIAVVTDASGNEIKRFEHNVHYSSPPVHVEWVREKSNAVADGVSQPVIAVRLSDKSGHPARSGIIGDVEISPPYHAADEPVTQLAAETFKPRFTVSEDGIAYIRLKPTTQSGEVKLTFRLENGPQEVRAWIKPATRDWIMVGLGSGTLGYNKLKGAIQPITNQSEKDKYYRDGRLAFYAKGRIKGDFLLTLAYDNAKTRGQVGNSLKQVIDPNQYYTVYGDASEQQYDAASQSKLYLKLERDTFYALFGDFDTGLTVTELSRYSRTMNGLKSEYRGGRLGYVAFASRTSQTMVKDELRGDGTSGLYHLSRKNIVANSEKVFIETRDRFRSEVILESQQLARHIDYDIDYQAGTLFFKQPVLSKDANLNPIYIRVEYEADDQNDQFTNFGGRASIKPSGNSEIGATYVRQGQLGKDNTLTGVDAGYKISDQTEVKAELARSDTRTTGRAKAWKAEVNHTGERLRAQAYVRQLDSGFGLGQTLGSEDGTRKIGANADAKLTKHLSLQTEAYRQQGLTTGSKRDLAQAQANYSVGRGSLRGGLRYAKDANGLGATTTSKQLTAGATTKITDRLSARVDREQNLGKGNNSVDFPTRTSVGADYQLTPATTLSATHEWTQGAKQNSETTRVGLRTQPWNGASLSTSYEQQLGESGTRSFANVGLEQQWQVTDTLSLQLGFDRTQTLRHPGATPLNLNAPLASGTSGLGSDNDFTAYSLGLTYRPEGWVWNNRIEYRTASTDKKWNLFTGIEGEPTDWLTSSFSLQWNRLRQTGGGRSDQGMSALALAWRPDYDGLMLLDRFQLVYSSQSVGGSTLTTWSYINNLAANWQISPAFQLAFNYGAKLTRDQIDALSLSGFTDAIGLQGTYDINEAWDISAQGGMLHTWHSGQYKPAFGFSIGHRLGANLWISLGYNFIGFYDKDFAAAEYTRQGVFLRFRFKLDQSDLKGMLESIQ